MMTASYSYDKRIERTFLNMPKAVRHCFLCRKTVRIHRAGFVRIYTSEREAKVREAYRRRYCGQEISQPILNQVVHKKCYNNIVQGVSFNENVYFSDENELSAMEDEDQNEQVIDNQTFQFEQHVVQQSI